MDINTSITTVACILGMTLATVVIKSCQQTEETRREAIKAGLVEKDGYRGNTLWSKPDE